MNQDSGATQSAPANDTKQSADVYLAKDEDTMRMLTERHNALGLFWLRLAELGLPKPLLKDREVNMQTGFLALDKKDALAVINGDTSIIKKNSSADACFVDYQGTVDETHNLILKLGIDCKIKPGPVLEIKPDHFYRMIISGLNAELKGKDLRLISISELSK